MTVPLLEVRNLTVRHGGLVALHDVSLEVEPASIVGLIGPNGAGKTTFIDTLSGFTRPAAGSVLLEGRALDGLEPHERARRGLVRTFQSLELFEDLTVRENLEITASPPTRWSLLSDLLPHRPRRHDDVEATLDLLELGALANRRPDELSNGERHRVALGRALVARPRLVLLDEPAAGLDEHETAELGRMLTELPGRGTAVLLVDHDMSIVLGVCHRVHVLDFGGLIASGTPEQVRHDPAVVSAYLGTEEH